MINFAVQKITACAKELAHIAENRQEIPEGANPKMISRYEHNTNKMKKTIMSMALLSATLLVSSAFDEQTFAPEEGALAPLISVTNDSGNVALEQMRGDYVLLSFWSSNDAQSRINCNYYAQWAEQHCGSIRHIAVNFDNDDAIFDEIIKIDALDAANQYNVTGDTASRIFRDYRLNEGFGTLLIDPKGRIIAANPELNALDSLS